MSKHHLRGECGSRRVWLDGKELDPRPSQKVWNHSPDGFNWGYAGSGPSQLALAIALQLTGDRSVAVAVCDSFKWDLVARLGGDFEVEFELDQTFRPMKTRLISPAIESKPQNSAAEPRSEQSASTNTREATDASV